MYIKFLYTTIEGFKSIDTLTFEWDKEGITRIIAPNGSGKSTIIEAFVWSLYGELMKGGTLSTIPTKPEYRSKHYIGTRVETSFEVEDKVYTVIRHYKYGGTTDGVKGGDSLMLFCDEELLFENRDKSDVQTAITDLLGVNYQTFLSSVIFGQRLKRLIESGDVDKREVFAHFFDMGFVDDALTNAKMERQKLETSLRDFEISLTKLQKDFEKYNELQIQQDSYIVQWNNNKKAKIDKLNLDLQELQRIKEPTKIPQPIQPQEPELIDNSKYVECSMVVSKKEQELERILSEISDLSKPLPDTCSACGGKIDITKAEKINKTKLTKLKKDKTLVPKDLETYKQELSALKKASDAYNEAFKEYKDTYDKYVQNMAAYNNYAADLQTYKNTSVKIAAIKHEIKTVEAEQLELPNYEALKTSTLSKLEVVENDIKKTTDLRNKYDFWVKTGFGASGVRNFIINSMLRYVNDTLSKYDFGMNIEIGVSLEGATKKFTTTLTDYNGIEFSYNELSGGEKARVDIALTFALFEVLGNFKTKFNILILDEAFENIDNNGVQVIFDMVRQISQKTNVFLITFIENIDTTYINNLYLTKVNNLTEYVN